MQNKIFFAFILLVLSSLFWSGNFLTAKLAFNYSLSPLKLSFFRWLLAFIIIVPFTFKDVFNHRELIKKDIYKMALELKNV